MSEYDLRRERLELAIAEAFGRGYTPWRLLAALGRLDEATPRRLRPRCGARCRDGHPCQAPAVWDRRRNRPRNGRCRMHGGLSTGPRTPEGKARIAASNRRRAKTRGSRQSACPMSPVVT